MRRVRPAPDVLRALGTTSARTAASDAPPTQGDRKPSQVWEYDGKQFTPIAVASGLADDGWTELLGGTLQPGRYVDMKSKPMTNLFLTMGEKLGVQGVSRFGDSTGTLSQI